MTEGRRRPAAQRLEDAADLVPVAGDPLAVELGAEERREAAVAADGLEGADRGDPTGPTCPRIGTPNSSSGKRGILPLQ